MSSERTLNALHKALPEGGLLAHGNWLLSPEPFPLTANQVAALEHLGYHLTLFQRAADLLYLLSARGRQPGWTAQLLDAGKPPELVELARDKAFRGSLPRVIRPDLLLTASGWTASELDNLPGGLGTTAWLNETYAALGFNVVGGAHGMIDGFASIAPSADIVISDESTDYRAEMQWLADRIGGCRVLRDKDWAAVEGRAVYRFFELFDLPEVACGHSALLAAREGRLELTPPPKPWIEEKLWFALFWLRPLREYWERELGRRHFQRLQEVVPYTWVVNPEPLPYHAALPRLEANSWEDVKAFSQKERQLILKISGFSPLAWGSRGVVAGSDVSQPIWAQAVDTALAQFPTNPWILQEFHLPRTIEHPWFDPDTGAIRMMKGRVRLCPYYFLADPAQPRLGGVLATIVPADKKLVHGMRDAILAPCAITG